MIGCPLLGNAPATYSVDAKTNERLACLEHLAACCVLWLRLVVGIAACTGSSESVGFPLHVAAHSRAVSIRWTRLRQPFKDPPSILS